VGIRADLGVRAGRADAVLVRDGGMTRVETIGDCTLILGDCRDVIPTLGAVDAVVTDPPYGVNFMESNTKWSIRDGVSYASYDDTRENMPPHRSRDAPARHVH